jgi:hypothetical protein
MKIPCKILASSKALQTILVFTVYVSNAALSTSSASVTIIIQNSLLPSIGVSLSKAKYNIGDTVFISGSIKTFSSIWANWTSSDMSLSEVALTPTYSLLGVGSKSFPLALSTGTLAPGKSYTLTLSAGYLLSNLSSFSQVVVIMNSPPTGGTISVTPTIGTALQTMFSISTSECESLD